jgi:formamidopyrimidine-DNA glycosylase
MPELPELEIVREVLERRVVGQSIVDVSILPPGGPIVVRDLTGKGFAATLSGQKMSSVRRRGKFLIFEFGERMPPVFLAINPKLTGRLQLAAPKDKRQPKTHVLFTLTNARQLRYVDQKQMGQLYLTENLGFVQDYAGLGPEALEISLDDFRRRLKPFRGEIKGVLTRGEFVAGIGNAYADEILWTARLHPFRKRTQLTPDEVERLYAGMRSTLLDAIDKVRLEMQENIDEKPRDFMAVHMKTGQPCPRCGTQISLIGANQRITNFCRTCQPGGLIRGMYPAY